MNKRYIFVGEVRIILIGLFLFAFIPVKAQTEVSLYHTFERSLENNNSYSNRFTDVNLTTTFISPSGIQTDFMGFFDGDGRGGGNKQSGNVWKFRFLPNEVGNWSYTWLWSDGTQGGQGTFTCVSKNAGKGILKAYENNPRWFAYNGTDPVWIKSYYESGHGSIGQPLDWLAENVYQPLIDRGYNHFQVNWLLSLCCFEQYYHDGPARSTSDLALYDDGKASSTMNLNVWQLMEQNVDWLNKKNVGLHMFLGFDGSRNGGPEWDNLSQSEKEFYIKYVMARLAPFANIAGWSFVWEVPGDRESYELGWARLVKEYDVFGHLRTYQDEAPKSNEYDRPEYNFAAVENHYMYSSSRDSDFPYWKSAWTHHEACLASYVTGKPVIMIEGNALWRRYWAQKVGATQDDLRQAAWGCATAGASFIWCGHQGEDELVAHGAEGLPFYGEVNPYASSATEIDILTDVMENEVVFYRMTPSDNLLSDHDNRKVWCLSELGEQYLVFSQGGSSFKLQLASGEYDYLWVDTKTGDKVSMPSVTATNNQTISFNPPNTSLDWVLLLRQGEQVSGKPTVSITSPSNNEVFIEGENITIKANASDNDGTITSVEFFEGSTLLGVDDSSPYSVTWNNVSVGSYSLKARATDNNNNTGTSSVVSVIVEPDMGDFSFCSNEGETCIFSGTVDVMYGADGQFNYLYGLTSGSVSCDNETFGDPIPGVEKACYVRHLSTTTYSLTTSINGNGSVSPSSGNFTEGSTISLTATPESGWQFSGWSGALTGTANPATLIMDSNKSVTATFTETSTEMYSLTTSVNGQGSVSPGSGSYSPGSEVTLKATPSTGWHFVNWSGDASGTSATITIAMDSDKSVTANFEADETGGGCDNPVTISTPFSKDGAGEFCWQTTGDISYVNSWNMKSLEINGVDFTNTWSSEMPPKQNGYYNIHYMAEYDWAHFEIASAKSAEILEDDKGKSSDFVILCFPNPVGDQLNILFSREVKEMVEVYLIDVKGKVVLSDKANGLHHTLDMSGVPIGLYTVKISIDNQDITERIMKQ